MSDAVVHYARALHVTGSNYRKPILHIWSDPVCGSELFVTGEELSERPVDVTCEACLELIGGKDILPRCTFGPAKEKDDERNAEDEE